MIRVATPQEEQSLRLRLVAHASRVALRHYRNPLEAGRALQALLAYVGQWQGRVGPAKTLAERDGWRMRPMSPRYPSQAFDTWLVRNLEEVHPTGEVGPQLSVVQFAITRRCPLHCAHCSAERELAQRDTLSLPQLKGMLDKLLDARVSQVVFTGGEPMVRLADLLELVRYGGPRSEYWVNTSGLGVNERAAAKLADVGVTGLWVSLDSDDPHVHDRMRGWPGAFDMAREAVVQAQRVGLTVGLSLVPTRAFIEGGGLDRYAELAIAWQVPMLRVITPKAVGRWQGESVALGADHLDRLTAWVDDLNGGARRSVTPFVLCDEVVSRRIGCKQAGVRSVYVDTDGEVHGCPFCPRSGGNLLEGSLEDALLALRAKGCSRFRDVKLEVA